MPGYRKRFLKQKQEMDQLREQISLSIVQPSVNRSSLKWRSGTLLANHPLQLSSLALSSSKQSLKPLERKLYWDNLASSSLKLEPKDVYADPKTPVAANHIELKLPNLKLTESSPIAQSTSKTLISSPSIH